MDGTENSSADAEVEKVAGATEGDEGVGEDKEAGLEDSQDNDDGAEGTGEEHSARADGHVDRISEAIRRAEEATRRADEAERRLREANSQRNNELSAAERKAKLEAMTPEERLAFMANEAMQRVDFESRKAQFVSQDLADKAEFLNRVANKPHLASLLPQVETKLADLRKQGQNVTREVMLKFVLGERAYNAAMKGASVRQKNAGAANVSRATTNATSGRGTMNGSARRSGDTAASRLQGVTF